MTLFMTQILMTSLLTHQKATSKMLNDKMFQETSVSELANYVDI